MVTRCQLITDAQHTAAEEARLALARSREADPAWMAANNATHGWASLREVAPPGTMWFCSWWFDPADPECASRRQRALADIAAAPGAKHGYLSNRYWLQWSDKRPPINVLCPNGQEWCVDANSNNGDGWTVTGDAPLITCTPSILVPGYHGWLKAGEFSDDVEGRGPNGVI